MNNSLDTSEQSATQGSNAEGQVPVMTYDGIVVTTTKSPEESASGVSAIAYFGLCWIALIVMIAALVYVLVECRCRSNQQKQQKQSMPVSHDVEVAEPVVAVEQRSSKINNIIGLTILFLGSFFGLGLSIFSITTCEFVTLETEITLDAPFDADQFSITIYNLGLWNVDITSNTALSGCVKAHNLPFFDVPYNFARASAIITVIFGAMGLLILYCVVIKPEFSGVKVRYLLVCIFISAALFQLMTLTLFGSIYCNMDSFEESKNNCTSSFGVVASVSAAMYWILEVVASTCVPLNVT